MRASHTDLGLVKRCKPCLCAALECCSEDFAEVRLGARKRKSVPEDPLHLPEMQVLACKGARVLSRVQGVEFWADKALIDNWDDAARPHLLRFSNVNTLLNVDV